MPHPGRCWRHVIFGTHGSWLPGDPRGWRSRHHHQHSSGDYKRPPPAGEHASLYSLHQRLCPTAVTIPKILRPILGQAILEVLAENDSRVLALAVSGQHTHVLAELSIDYATSRKVVGRCKNISSLRVRDKMPGKIWATGGKFARIDDVEHQRAVYAYILRHAKERAWVWSFREGE